MAADVNMLLNGLRPSGIEPYWVAQQRAAQMQGMQRNALMQQMQYEDAMQQRQQQAQQAQQNALMQQVRQRELGAMNSGAGPAMPFDPMRLLATGAFKPAEVKTMGEVINPARKLHNVGDTAIDERTGLPVFTAPQKNPMEPLFRAAGIDPASPQGRQMALDKLRKETTHAPAATAISYGSPIPAMNPKTGQPEFVRPDNKGGMAFTGVSPPPQNRDTKVPAEIQRMNIAADSMVSLLGDYEAWLKKNNPRDPTTQMSAGRRSEMQSLMKNIQLQYKELAALGALTGPDLALMESALSDPFTMRGAYYGKDGLLSQIAQARRLVDVRRAAIKGNSGQTAQDGAAPPAAADPLGLRGN